MTKNKKVLKKGGACACSKNSFFNGGNNAGVLPPHDPTILEIPQNSNASPPIINGGSITKFKNNLYKKNLKGLNKRKTRGQTKKNNKHKISIFSRGTEGYKNINKQSRRRKEKKYSLKRYNKNINGGNFITSLGGISSGISDYYTTNQLKNLISNPQESPGGAIVSGSSSYRSF